MIWMKKNPKHGNEQCSLFDGCTGTKRQGGGDRCSVIKMINRAAGDGCSRIKMINRAAEWLLRDKIIKRAEDVPRLWTC